MFTRFLFYLLLLSFVQLTYAQNLLPPDSRRHNAHKSTSHTCGTDYVNNNLREQNPVIEQISKQAEELYRQQVKDMGSNAYNRMGGDPILTIPVVVHVVHRTGIAVGTEENLSDAVINNVINELNARYAHTSGLTFANPYSGIGLDIELCLAKRDPSGNFTSGIVRHADNALCENDMDTYNTQLAYYWNTTQYMNIYIVRSITGGAAGYSTLAGSHGNNGDGVVMLHSAWWSGLLAHETGHYFNLQHNFQGGCPNSNCLTNGDLVCDTPPKASPGGAGTGCSPSNSCNTDSDDTSVNNPFRPNAMGGLGDVTDSNENYMDYSGGCWNAYTYGQRLRMRTAITTTRASLLTNNYCFFTNNDAGITGVTSPAASVCQATVTPVVTLRNFGGATLTSVSILAFVNTAWQYTYAWTGSLATDGTTNVTLPNLTLAPGANTLSFFTQDPNSSADGYTANDTFTFDVNYGGTPPPMSQNFEGAFVPAQWSLINPDGATTWQQTATTCNANSAYINNYSYNAPGNLDHLQSPLVSLAGYGSASLSFDVAYAIFPGYSDALTVSVSTDCGATFTDVFNKSGSTLATAPSNTASFVPTDCSQWRTETIDLNAYIGSEIIIRFTNENGYGNNLYLDNISLIGTATPANRVRARILLEGALNTVCCNMRTDLRDNGYLPTVQPYSVGFFYTGGESVTTFPPNVVDWVLIDVWSDLGYMRTACFVRNDGYLVATDGLEGVLIPLPAGAYRIAVYHRNHFRIYSNAVTLPMTGTLDLTNPTNIETLGGVKEVAPGVYAMVAGNASIDRVINFADFNQFYQQYWSVGLGNYLGGDTNLDGNVDNPDFNLIRQNTGRINFLDLGPF